MVTVNRKRLIITKFRVNGNPLGTCKSLLTLNLSCVVHKLMHTGLFGRKGKGNKIMLLYALHEVHKIIDILVVPSLFFYPPSSRSEKQQHYVILFYFSSKNKIPMQKLFFILYFSRTITSFQNLL